MSQGEQVENGDYGTTRAKTISLVQILDHKFIRFMP